MSFSCYARRLSGVRHPKVLSSPRWTSPVSRLAVPAARRYLNDGGMSLAIDEELAQQEKLRGKVDPSLWDEYKASCLYISKYNPSALG